MDIWSLVFIAVMFLLLGVVMLWTYRRFLRRKPGGASAAAGETPDTARFTVV